MTPTLETVARSPTRGAPRRGLRPERPRGAEAYVGSPQGRDIPVPARTARVPDTREPATAAEDTLLGGCASRIEVRARPVVRAASRVDHAVDRRRGGERSRWLGLRGFLARLADLAEAGVSKVAPREHAPIRSSRRLLAFFLGRQAPLAAGRLRLPRAVRDGVVPRHTRHRDQPFEVRAVVSETARPSPDYSPGGKKP